MFNRIARKSWLAIPLAMLLGGGCATLPENRVPSPAEGAMPSGSSSSLAAEINQNLAVAAAMQAPHATADYRIGPEDLLQITLFNIPEADGRVTPRTITARVSQEGNVTLPLLGEVSVKGSTVSGFEQALREKYDKYIYNPQVGVLVTEYRQRVSIIGAVNKAGVFELTGPKTVIDILAMAGGVTERAGSQVHVYRQGPNGRESHVIDLAVLAGSSPGLINAANAPMVNMPVEAGDMINVPQAGMFFVDGAVKRPGSYPLGRQYFLTQALATAGGVDSELNSNDITIYRRKGPGKVDTIALDLNAVMAGAAADPQIQPDDVIVVPTSTGKYLVRRFIGTLLGGMSIGSFIPR